MHIIRTQNHVQNIAAQLQARGLRAGGATRRYFNRLQYDARCRDLVAIRTEAMASRTRTWADM